MRDPNDPLSDDPARHGQAFADLNAQISASAVEVKSVDSQEPRVGASNASTAILCTTADAGRELPGVRQAHVTAWATC